MSEPGAALSPWRRAELAAALVALDAGLGGLVLRCPAGAVRDAWLARFTALLEGRPLRRMPAGIGDQALLGGLDLAATLASGRPVAARGLLAEAGGGIVLAAMAERLPPETAARLALALDRDGGERFGVVAFDEGAGPEERPPAALVERLALMLDLTELSHREIEPAGITLDHVAEARAGLGAVVADETVIEALCAAALALGAGSARAPLQALRAARGLAALAGRTAVAQEDAAFAATLVLAPRATRLPVQETEETPPPPQPDSPSPESEGEVTDAGELEDRVLEAAQAALPPGLLAQLLAQGGGRARGAGRAGAQQKAAQRGRKIGARPGEPRGRARLDVVETLRAAAPWQVLRRRESGRAGLILRRDDFRVTRWRQRGQSTTLFVVDASGSAALQRLAEAKGAVRLLLAECYVRRDEVALIVFRRSQADILLPPTRSLVAAERALAALPGGGATPLATAIATAAKLADAIRREGRAPTLVFMTDGRANIDRDGQPGRAKAQADALAAARLLSVEALNTLLIDTSPQPQAPAAELAAAMGALYLPLPHADAAAVSRAVGALSAGR